MVPPIGGFVISRLASVCDYLGCDCGKICALVALLFLGLTGCARGMLVAEHGTLAVFSALLVALMSRQTIISHGARVALLLFLLVSETVAYQMQIRSAELMALSTLAALLMQINERHRPRR